MTEPTTTYEVKDAVRLAEADGERPQLLATIAKQLSKANRHTIAIQAAIEALEDVGTFKHAPLGEQWTKRNKGNPTEYLYLTFRRDRYRGTYQGPDGKKRVYIGIKEAKITAARAKVTRTKRRDELQTELRRHEQWCSSRAWDLKKLAKLADHWEPADLRTGLTERDYVKSHLPTTADVVHALQTEGASHG